MPFLVVGLLAYIEVTGSVTFYEEHTEAKAGFVEMSYDYKDATGYEVHTSFGRPQLTLQFGFCRIKLFGLYGDYSEAFWDADMSEGHRDIKYIAYLVEKLDAYEVEGTLYDRKTVTVWMNGQAIDAQAYIYKKDVSGCPLMRRAWNSEV